MTATPAGFGIEPDRIQEKPGVDTGDTALLKGSQGFIKHEESSQSREKSDQLTVIGYQKRGSLTSLKT